MRNERRLFAVLRPVSPLLVLVVVPTPGAEVRRNTQAGGGEGGEDASVLCVLGQSVSALRPPAEGQRQSTGCVCSSSRREEQQQSGQQRTRADGVGRPSTPIVIDPRLLGLLSLPSPGPLPGSAGRCSRWLLSDLPIACRHAYPSTLLLPLPSRIQSSVHPFLRALVSLSL